MFSVMLFATYIIVGFMITSLALVTVMWVWEMYNERKHRKDND